MTVEELEDMMLAITSARNENGTIQNGFIQFNIGDEDGPYTVNRIYQDEDGDVCVESNEEDEDEYTVDQIGTEVSAFPEDTYVYFKVVDEDGDEENYDFTDEWEIDDDGDTLVELCDNDDDYYDDDDDDDEDGEEYDTMSVGRLRKIISLYDPDQKLYVSDGDDISNCTVDSVYLRNGEAVLQSNEIEGTQDHSFTLGYLLHCLEWFSEDCPACFMHCDEDNDFGFYNIDDYHTDDDGDLVLEISGR